MKDGFPSGDHTMSDLGPADGLEPDQYNWYYGLDQSSEENEDQDQHEEANDPEYIIVTDENSPPARSQRNNPMTTPIKAI